MLRAGWFYEGIQGTDLAKLIEACDKYNLNKILLSSLILSRLYGVVYVLLGTADGKTLDQPFELNKLGIGRLEFFTVIKRNISRQIKPSI